MLRLVRFFFLLFSFSLLAQNGDYYLRHFQPQLPNIDNDNYALEHDNLNRLYIGNRQGLIQYDGKSWNIIPTSGTVFSLLYDTASAVMYVGCMNSAGIIVQDEKGKFSYQTVTDPKAAVKNVTKILNNDKFIYFVSENSLIEYSPKDKKITNTWKEALTSAFLLNKQLHVQKPDGSIWRWNNGSMINAAIKYMNETVLFSQNLDGADIIGTDKSNLYYFINGSLTRLAVQDSLHIKQGQLTDGKLLGKNSMLLSTVKAGCLLIQVPTGKTLSLIHLFSGLPDNEVFAIGNDLSGGAWIAHEYGLSRLDAALPYRCYSNYLGLAGHINNVLSFKNQTYVGTNEGIFILNPKTYFTNTISTYKLPKKVYTQEGKTTVVNNEAIAEKTRQQRKRSVFKIFSRKKKNEDEAAVVEKKEEKPLEKLQQLFAPKEPVLVKVQEGAKLYSYEYVKLKLPELKCEQLMNYDDQLWAGTNRGIYILRGEISQSICDDNIRFIYGSRFSKTLFASTTEGKVLAFSKLNGVWKKLSFFDFVKQPISSIEEDEQGNLWLAGIDKLYKVKIVNNAAEDIEEYEIENPFSDNIILTRQDSKLVIYWSGQFFNYDSQTKKLVPAPEMDGQFASHDQLIYKQSEIIWMAENNRWKVINESIASKPNLNYISLFHAIRSLFYDADRNSVWIVTKEDELFKLDVSKDIKLPHQPKVILSSINDENGASLAFTPIHLDYDNNNLNFYFSSPDFYNQENLEYQYKIDGLNDTWSSWTNDNSVLLHFLNPGKYKLSVKVKNTFGQEAELDPISFKILPPYWQTWWFYLLEVVVFASCWFFTVKLSRKQLRNQIFVKLFTLLTLVMTVEFMSTVAENMINLKVSPVIDFIVKVLIAVCLLPIEKLLARVIRNKE